VLFALALAATLGACATGDEVEAPPVTAPSPTTSGAPTKPPSTAPPAEAPTPSAPLIETKGLPRGAAPTIAYRRATEVDFGRGNWRLVRPDGSTQTLDEATWEAFALLGDGVVGTFHTEAGVALDIVGPDGALDREVGFEHFGLATTPDHSIVAYLDDDGVVRSIEDSGRRRLAFQPVRAAKHLGAIIGEGTCQEAVPEGGGCAAFVDQRRGRTSIVVSHGIVEQLPVLRTVADALMDVRKIGQVTSGPERCDGLVSPRDTLRWQTCDSRLEEFSPDGKHVLGTSAGGPVENIDGVTVFGLSGEPVASWSWRADFPRRLVDVTWEDDEHLLAVVHAGGRWTVLRLGLDQSVERATRWIASGPDYATYQLPL
jgi:hypothetical protein